MQNAFQTSPWFSVNSTPTNSKWSNIHHKSIQNPWNICAKSRKMPQGLFGMPNRALNVFYWNSIQNQSSKYIESLIQNCENGSKMEPNAPKMKVKSIKSYPSGCAPNGSKTLPLGKGTRPFWVFLLNMCKIHQNGAKMKPNWNPNR